MPDEPTLILRSAKTCRPSIWNDDDYDVLSEDKVVGLIFKMAAFRKTWLRE
jgi:hypothetical protein